MLGYKAITRALIVGSLYFPLLALEASSGPREARASEEQRYPYDPVCAWGRLADGRGMLVRCLKEDEATALVTPASASPAVATPAASAGKSEESAASAPVAAPASSPALDPKMAPDSATAPEREITVGTIGPIVVDSGELPLAVKKLSEPKDKYIDCVRKNGGLQADSAEVQVRFLVRERGRAEGVSVAKRKGMSQQAAQCIADVVDRRYVGYPAAPIVGATLPILVSYKGK